MTKELPDDVRVPLHSLQADAAYLIGRVAADGAVSGMVVDSIQNRLSQIETACYGAREAALEDAARVVERYSLPTIQAPSMWLIDKAAIAAEIRNLSAAPASPVGEDVVEIVKDLAYLWLRDSNGGRENVVNSGHDAADLVHRARAALAAIGRT